MSDLEKERQELLKLIEENIDPELAKLLEITSNSIIREEKENDITVTSEGTTNA